MKRWKHRHPISLATPNTTEATHFTRKTLHNWNNYDDITSSEKKHINCKVRNMYHCRKKKKKPWNDENHYRDSSLNDNCSEFGQLSFLHIHFFIFFVFWLLLRHSFLHFVCILLASHYIPIVQLSFLIKVIIQKNNNKKRAEDTVILSKG